MKKIILTLLLLGSLIIYSQEKILTKSGIITLNASFPSFDKVEGTNSNVTFVLNPATGEIASLAILKGFHFEIALMEEHFNENYMETDKYPKAIFRGIIQGFNENNLTEDYKDYTINGKLELHGIAKEISINAKIRKWGARITILSNFSVHTSDFSIPIPSLIKYKLASEVNIELAAVLVH